MAHEIHHDDGFHEIQLSGKQLVFLFMATTVVLTVIFLCGVLVGRGVTNARGTVAEAAGLETSAGAINDEDTAAAPNSGKPTPVEGLSYAENLSSSNPPPATVEPGAGDALKQRTEPPAPTEAPAETPAPPEPAPPAKATSAAKETAVPKEAPAPKDAPPPPPPASASSPAPAEDGGFTVQVTALKNKGEADAIAQRLQTRGYQAYVVAPAAGGQVIYKVRVGMNMQRPEADKVMRRLQSEEKFKPWITR